jgi:hypothetical protein
MAIRAGHVSILERAFDGQKYTSKSSKPALITLFTSAIQQVAPGDPEHPPRFFVIAITDLPYNHDSMSMSFLSALHPFRSSRLFLVFSGPHRLESAEICLELGELYSTDDGHTPKTSQRKIVRPFRQSVWGVRLARRKYLGPLRPQSAT